MDAIGRILAAILLTLFLAGLSFLYLRETFIYFFVEENLPPSDIPRTEVRQIPAFGEDPALTVWVTQPEDGQPVILYFMGAAGALGVYEPQIRDFANAGFGVAAMSYRSGGGQAGRPSEETLYRDARRLYVGLDTLFGRHVPENERILYGYSLGAALAVRLATDQPELAVILEAPFTRLCDSNLDMGTIVPGCVLLKGHEYEIEGRIADIDAPLLILHGTADQRVPIALGEAVFDAAALPKFLERYEGGLHEDLSRYDAVEDAISFVRVLRGARR